MKRSSVLAEFRELEMDDITVRLSELQGELIRLRFQLAIRQLENHRRIREVRKQIAQIKSIQRARELEDVSA